MSLSIFLAKVMGLYFIITGLFTIIRYRYIKALVLSIATHSSTIFLVALITLITGILLVVSHNVWVADWRVVITILAWLTFLAGIYRLFFPEAVVKSSSWLVHHKGFFFGISIIFLLVGCYLAYHGFNVGWAFMPNKPN